MTPDTPVPPDMAHVTADNVMPATTDAMMTGSLALMYRNATLELITPYINSPALEVKGGKPLFSVRNCHAPSLDIYCRGKQPVGSPPCGVYWPHIR